MDTEIWVAVIGTGGIITTAAITQLFQLRKSKSEGVKKEDVHSGPVPTDPNEGWKEYVAGLKDRAEKAENKLKSERDLRWAAIHYIRRLLEWILRQFPDAEIPPVPTELSTYITIPRKDKK